MLRRLELAGFKSFADRTAFEFAPGITAVVGPNGSGKSNIIDAVKWILGEQSAKSLRGSEMSDVIFNGSASRKAAAMAEVVMLFDNSKRALASERDEVQIARRLYRDGTSEYLIDNRSVRLKDIRDLFLGSGAGAGAYSIIEQGKVDALLQASNTDRRTIFEEAAGISRFKARKLETLRKLETVEGNLTRIRDIHAEVDKQLRKVRLDASKALKFQEYSDELRELRYGISIGDYGGIEGRIAVLSAEIGGVKSGHGETQDQIARQEVELRDLEVSRGRLEARLTASVAELAEVRTTLTRSAEVARHELQKGDEFARELRRVHLRELNLLRASREAFASLDAAEAELLDTDKLARDQTRHNAESADRLVRVETRQTTLRQQMQLDRAAQVDLVRQASTLHTQAENARQQLERQNREREARNQRIETRVAELEAIDRALGNLSQADADIQSKLGSITGSLHEKLAEREALSTRESAEKVGLEGLRVQREGIRTRVEVLEGLERAQEGLGTGVKQIVELLADEPDGELARNTWGLVADLLTVPREVAPLIDLALGDSSQCFLVRDMDALTAWLGKRKKPLTGRVRFVELVAPTSAVTTSKVVRDSADHLVSCERPELADLPRQLLGQCRIAEVLADARAFAAKKPGFRYVTRDGELLEADGTLTVGTHHSETGILSRKSELRELKQQLRATDREIAAIETRIRAVRQAIDKLGAPIHSLEHELQLVTNRAGDLQSQMSSHRQQREQLEDDIRLMRLEVATLEQEAASTQTTWHDTRQRSEHAEKAAAELRVRLEEAELSARLLEQDRADRQKELTELRIAHASTEERLRGLRLRVSSLLRDADEARTELERTESHAADLTTRVRDCQLLSLRESMKQAELYARKDGLESHIGADSHQRDGESGRRTWLGESLQAIRQAYRDQLDAIHQRELTLRDLQNQRTQLVEQLRAEYQVELPELYKRFDALAAKPVLPERGPSEASIRDLRDRIRRLGSVSLESIAELKEVEGRATELQSQIDDLTQSSASLTDIIERINADSRRMFAETFEAVRVQFQELFRKLFGGGMADVILENPDDVLESGIEIQARPPGKELRSISLMSGGEKTMTAIALLLAIFRSRPSPFCLLDEVDAALDEANTTRLASALKEFMNQSQFIVITHKKRTMAAAEMLCGITMQESGVSRQVAIQLRDWPEEEAA